ncbi:MAG: Bug family tripartite tricarboxylate transporter substrate binding protein [Xanthobacteraceae bacterium]
MKRLAATLVVMAVLTTTTSAQDWPSRPVRIINTFAPGGAADQLARIAADHLSTAFKQQFFVENRAGAAGVIGMQAVAAAEPDGYTFGINTLSLSVIIPMTNPKAGYDPVKDLTPVAYLAGTPIVLVVSPKSGIRTLKDFVAKSRASSKPLSYGTSGLSSVGQMVAQSFELAAKLKFDVVPYKGAAQSLLDVIANHIDFATPTLTSAAGQIRGDAIVPLALAADKRMPDYPDLPTFKELGYDVVGVNWFGLVGPARLPNDIAVKVNREINVVMSKPASQQRMRADGMLVDPMDVVQFRKFIADETVRWTPVIEKSGLLKK